MDTDESKTVLGQLGRQLLARGSSAMTGSPILPPGWGGSIPALRKLEQGDPTVAMGSWVDAVWLLGRLDRLAEVLAAKPSLFDLDGIFAHQ